MKLKSSLRLRIVIWILAPMTILAILLTSGAAIVFQQQTEQRISESLSREASELVLLSENIEFESSQELLQRFVERSSPDVDEQIIAIVNDRVFLRSGSSSFRLDQDSDFLSLVTSVDSTTFGEFSQGVNYRWISIPVNSLVDSGFLVSAFSVDRQNNQTLVAIFSFIGVAIFSLFVASIFGWFASGRIFRPIGAMSKAASEIGHDDLTSRIPLQGNNNELDSLATEFNSMLDRLEESFKNQRSFVDDAGHELRTPLTVIRGHLDLVMQDPKANAQSLEIIRDELSRMSRLVFDLQTLTKSNQPEFVRLEPVNLQILNDELYVKAESLAERSWIQSADDLDIELMLDRQRITQAFLQLVENACKQTADGDAIEIGISLQGGQVSFFVDDSGPGIAEQDREKVLQRFARGAGHAESGEGSGLGLAVADAIAKSHKGFIQIDDGSQGGARVAIVLPQGES